MELFYIAVTIETCSNHSPTRTTLNIIEGNSRRGADYVKD